MVGDFVKTFYQACRLPSVNRPWRLPRSSCSSLLLLLIVPSSARPSPVVERRRPAPVVVNEEHLRQHDQTEHGEEDHDKEEAQALALLHGLKKIEKHNRIYERNFLFASNHLAHLCDPAPGEAQLPSGQPHSASSGSRPLLLLPLLSHFLPLSSRRDEKKNLFRGPPPPPPSIIPPISSSSSFC